MTTGMGGTAMRTSHPRRAPAAPLLCAGLLVALFSTISTRPVSAIERDVRDRDAPDGKDALDEEAKRTARAAPKVAATDPGNRRAALPAGYETAEMIAAIVGKQVVTLSQLRRALGQQQASAQLVPTDAGRPRDLRALLRQTLESLVEGELVLAAARDLGLTVDDSEVEKMIDQQKRRNGWDDEDLTEAALALGFPSLPAYREHVRSEQLKVKMLRVKLGSRLSVTDEDVARTIELEHCKGTCETEVHAKHILIRVPPTAPPPLVNQLRKKAWKVHDECVEDPELFGQIADEVSDDMGTTEGELGWMKRWALEPSFARELWSMKVDEISGVIQTPFGFHIIQKLGVRKAPVKDKRLLNQVVRARLSEEQFARLYTSWIAELKANNHVELRL
jgi:peptidyl-prolyl cis-trans isomerase SurA